VITDIGLDHILIAWATVRREFTRAKADIMFKKNVTFCRPEIRVVVEKIASSNNGKTQNAEIHVLRFTAINRAFNFCPCFSTSATLLAAAAMDLVKMQRGPAHTPA